MILLDLGAWNPIREHSHAAVKRINVKWLRNKMHAAFSRKHKFYLISVWLAIVDKVPDCLAMFLRVVSHEIIHIHHPVLVILVHKLSATTFEYGVRTAEVIEGGTAAHLGNGVHGYLSERFAVHADIGTQTEGATEGADFVLYAVVLLQGVDVVVLEVVVGGREVGQSFPLRTSLIT